MLTSKEDRHGLSACPYDFYAKWINDPDGARDMVRSLTRETVGTEECPIENIPFGGHR